MDCHIEYMLTGTGWADCIVRSGDQSCLITASYLSDALRNLLLAGSTVLAGFRRVSFGFDEEPGEYRWVITGDAMSAVDVEILEFQELWGEKPDTEGRSIFKMRCQRIVLAKAIAAAARDVLEKHGERDYLKMWGEHAFPSGPFAGLIKAIALYDDKHGN